MKILISAYACEPGQGSEPAVGWGFVQQAAKLHEVWVITRKNNRPIIEAQIGKKDNPHFVYYDLPYWLRFWKKGQRGIYLYYFLWQIGIYFKARKLNKQIKFDLIHHITFVNYWMPSLLSLLPVSFIWGPVGGGESAPDVLRKRLRFKARIYELARDLARLFGEHNPLVRLTARRCALAIATSEETAERLRKIGCKNIVILSQVALQTNEIENLNTGPSLDDNTFRFISIGRLLHWKGFDLGINAFAASRLPQAEYWIIGDGPARETLEKLSINQGIRDRVKFFGQLPREQTLQKLKQCDVLVHPSMHESGGWVCAEAAAAGKPVICLDLGGPAVQVTEETGYKIQVKSYDQIINDISFAMTELYCNEDKRRELGNNGKIRVAHTFSWDVKGKIMEGFYKQIIDSKSSCSYQNVETRRFVQ